MFGPRFISLGLQETLGLNSVPVVGGRVTTSSGGKLAGTLLFGVFKLKRVSRVYVIRVILILIQLIAKDAYNNKKITLLSKFKHFFLEILVLTVSPPYSNKNQYCRQE